MSSKQGEVLFAAESPYAQSRHSKIPPSGGVINPGATCIQTYWIVPGFVDGNGFTIYNSYVWDWLIGYSTMVPPIKEYYDTHDPNEVTKVFADRNETCGLLLAPTGPSGCHVEERRSNQNYKNQNYSDLIFYPNPSSKTITIENAELESTIKICNIMGKIMIENKVKESYLQLDISDLAPGIYFIQTEKNKSYMFVKI